ncbi:hypothetical protein [uncultured Microbulbifer sp.]|uniref:hypothetical protein n=1 Tax=uncultured Microbulbifer sp. TaxID=348147 RepID=UPI00262E664F|nr:hypothetical protein [uncultured Microbulbifer sp.]
MENANTLDFGQERVAATIQAQGYRGRKRGRSDVHSNRLLQIKTRAISDGAELREGTLLRVNVAGANCGGEQGGSVGYGSVEYVVSAGYQNQYEYALDLASAINTQKNIPISAGERQADGSLRASGSSCLNWIWGPEGNFTASIERLDPVQMTTIGGQSLAAGQLLEVLILNAGIYSQHMRFQYRVPSDFHGKSWRWPAALSRVINACAEQNNYPVRAGEFDRDTGAIKTVESTDRNKIWVATSDAGQVMVKIRADGQLVRFQSDYPQTQKYLVG